MPRGHDVLSEVPAFSLFPDFEDAERPEVLPWRQATALGQGERPTCHFTLKLPPDETGHV